MPGIGAPQIKHPFQDIRRSAAGDGFTQETKAAEAESDLGKELNHLAGVSEEKLFVNKDEHGKLDKNAFLKLLSNQLQNQDPFNPADQKEFAADLAQFSQLEQLANLNSKFEKSNNNNFYREKFMGASLLGKEILTSGSSIEHSGKAQKINLPFGLSRPAKKIVVKIFDPSNSMIKQIELDGRGSGSQSVLWDGMSSDGVPAMKGVYRFEVTAWDGQFNEFKGDTKTRGIVTGVSFEEGEVILTVGGKNKVFLRDVDSFSLPSGK